MTLADDLLRVLPAGEWDSPVVVSDAIGVMAKRAVRAKATWTRRNIPVFLKCIPIQRAGAGPTTALLTDPARLENVRLRLERARTSPGPLVTLHRVEWLDGQKWLLIAMDPVTPISTKVDAKKPDPKLACAVLRQLNVARCSGWFHFDICPSNTGVTSAGGVVFIDPESYFELTRPDANISIGFAKWPRLSPVLLAEINACSDPAVLPADVVERKHNYEVVLLAAECCLGQFNRMNDEAGIRDWCADPDLDEPMRKFWLPHLLELCAGRIPDPEKVATALERVKVAPTTVAVRPAVAPPKPQPKEVPLEFANLVDWPDFEPVRRAMRERRLSAKQLTEYRERLLDRAAAEPSRREWWVELLMVTLVFDIDPAEAAKVADAALKHHPGDAEFVRDGQMARRWRDA